MSWPLVLALDDHVVARRGRRESNSGLARVVAEARRLALRCLTYEDRAQTSIAPVRGKRGFDELGRELGRKDLAVFRVYAMLLRAIGARGKLIFSEMDVFWRRSPASLFASLDGEGDALRCSAPRAVPPRRVAAGGDVLPPRRRAPPDGARALRRRGRRAGVGGAAEGERPGVARALCACLVT